MPRLIERSTTLLVGEDELRALELDPDGASLLSDTTSTVVVKRGSAGAEIVAHDERFTQQVRPVRVVDAVGAGDAFAAGWISASLLDLDRRRSALLASIVASLVVATPGDVVGFPTRTELDTIAENGRDVVR